MKNKKPFPLFLYYLSIINLSINHILLKNLSNNISIHDKITIDLPPHNPCLFSLLALSNAVSQARIPQQINNEQQRSDHQQDKQLRYPRYGSYHIDSCRSEGSGQSYQPQTVSTYPLGNQCTYSIE